jgi:hypothetical protein
MVAGIRSEDGSHDDEMGHALCPADFAEAFGIPGYAASDDECEIMGLEV